MFNSGLYKLDPREKKILSIISEKGIQLQFPLFVVGGFVRDKILGRPCKDIDIVCEGDGIQLAQEVASAFRPIPTVNYFDRFGTAMIKHGDLEIEFVGARKESYKHDSRKPLITPGTIEDDQLRRDFTINTLSISLNSQDLGEIIDPFNGLDDLTSRIIRTPNDPDITFSDDPLRMMRAIRFSSQLGFSIEQKTWEGIVRNADRLKIVSRERISAELDKIILSPVPSVGFDLLFKSGLLKIFLPELCLLHGAEYLDGKGHKDNFYHTLQVLDNLALQTDHLWLRWAAILHDIAKPQTKRYESEIGWTFHGHEVLGAAMVPRIFKNLRMPLDHKMKYVQKLVRLHLRPIALTQEQITDSALRRLLFEAGEDLEDLLLLCEADITSKNSDKVKKYLNNYSIVRQKLQEVEEKDKIRAWQPPISGEKIMEIYGLPPCREVGIIKNAIREAILEGEIPNQLDAAMELMDQIALKLKLKKVQLT
ncbi:MAG: HD domain-containing protein [Saprospiraceae bacterium]|nr:HD domain-containing protein [Saprospiraceae bacterium]